MMQLLEIITVGFPFCIFKLITGMHFDLKGFAILGAVDFILNLLNLVSVFFRRKRLTEACLFSFVLCRLKKPKPERLSVWQDFGNSLDVALSFLIVAVVIGGGHIPELSQDALRLWNIAVIFNVAGAGLGRMTTSLKSLRSSSQ